jgi:Na+/H+ antiporter NhaD/arsenite permease-like protein
MKEARIKNTNLLYTKILGGTDLFLVLLIRILSDEKEAHLFFAISLILLGAFLFFVWTIFKKSEEKEMEKNKQREYRWDDLIILSSTMVAVVMVLLTAGSETPLNEGWIALSSFGGLSY